MVIEIKCFFFFRTLKKFLKIFKLVRVISVVAIVLSIEVSLCGCGGV